MKNKIMNKGQAALVVLIISAVVLTLGLSVSRKTVTETKITSNDEEMKQAFNTAESGIEYYLSTGNKVYNDSTSNLSANVSTNDIASSSIGAGSYLMDYNEMTVANSTMIFWLAGHNQATGNIDMLTKYSGSVDVCVDNSFTGSLKVDYFYTNSTNGLGTYGVGRSGFDLGSNNINGYKDVAPANNTCATGKKLVVTINAGDPVPLMVAVTPLFAPTHLAVRTSSSLPVQGEEISATTVVGDQSTGVKRTVRQVRRFEVPKFFIEAVTSEGSIDTNYAN